MSMMAFKYLPNEVLVAVIASHLPNAISAHEYVQLRLVNRQFSDIVLYALFDLNVAIDNYAGKIGLLQRNEHFVFRYWKAFLQPHNVRLRQQTWERVNLEQQNNLHDGQRPTTDKMGYKEVVLSALQRAIPQITLRLESLDPECLGLSPVGSKLFKENLSTTEMCIYAMCHAAICIHGSSHAWNLLTDHIEKDYHGSRTHPEQWFTSVHSVDVWRLYAAAYLNDIQEIKAILEPLRVKPPDRAVWRRRLSAHYTIFIHAYARMYDDRQGERYPKATFKEQRWIKMASSALVIAASLGHTNIASYLMQLEPNLFRNAPRTQLYRTSWRSAMGQAIEMEQRQVFKVLLRHKWPLVTSTGFARNNYFNALRIAIENAPISVEPDSILQLLWNMSDAWKCPYILRFMLQNAARRNSIELGKITLDEITRERQGMATYHWTRADTPSLWLRWEQQECALEAAAHAGNVDFVRFLLREGSIPEEIGNLAKERAIHSIVCHVTDLKDEHMTILTELCGITENSCLEAALVLAVFRYEKRPVDILLPKINLNKEMCSDWTFDCTRNYCIAEKVTPTILTNLARQATVGEFLLATALKKLKWEIAHTLIGKYGVMLRYYYIKTCPPEMVYPMNGFAPFRDALVQHDMNITLEISRNDSEDARTSNVSCIVTFNPAFCKEIEPIEFNAE